MTYTISLRIVCYLSLGSSIFFMACSRTPQSPPSSAESTFIQYVANEGVLIHTPNTSILIDAVHLPYRDQYAATPDSMFQRMLNSQVPFDRVKYALVSHVHRDHQSASQLLKLMDERPSIQLIAPKQAIDSIQAFGEAGLEKYSILSLENEKPQLIVEQTSLQITSIPIPHTYPQLNSWVQHYAYLIEADERTYLHLGDTYAVNKHLKSLAAALPDTIDVAMVPFWFMYDKAWDWLNETIVVKQILAIHVPIPDAAKLEAELEAQNSKIKVLHRLGDRIYYD